MDTELELGHLGLSMPATPTRYLISVQLHTFFFSFSAFQGAFAIGNAYFKLLPGLQTWGEARQQCIDLGGNLAELTTRSKLDAVLRELQRLSRSHNSNDNCKSPKI